MHFCRYLSPLPWNIWKNCDLLHLTCMILCSKFSWYWLSGYKEGEKWFTTMTITFQSEKQTWDFGSGELKSTEENYGTCRPTSIQTWINTIFYVISAVAPQKYDVTHILEVPPCLICACLHIPNAAIS